MPEDQVQSQPPEPAAVHSVGSGLYEVHRMVALFSKIEERQPDSTARCLVEVGAVLLIVAKAARRAHVTADQMIDIRRRIAFLEKQLNG